MRLFLMLRLKLMICLSNHLDNRHHSKHDPTMAMNPSHLIYQRKNETERDRGKTPKANPRLLVSSHYMWPLRAQPVSSIRHQLSTWYDTIVLPRSRIKIVATSGHVIRHDIVAFSTDTSQSTTPLGGGRSGQSQCLRTLPSSGKDRLSEAKWVMGELVLVHKRIKNGK